MVVIFVGLHIIDVIEINNRIEDYNNKNIKTVLLPDYNASNYIFIDENIILYYAGSEKIILFNIDSQKKEIIKIKNNYKNIALYNFQYNKEDGCVYFLLIEDNSTHFFSLELNSRSFVEHFDFKNVALRYWITQDKGEQFVYFYIDKSYYMSVYNITQRQMVSGFILPNEIKNCTLRDFNPEKGILLFSYIEYANNFSIARQFYYLYNILSNESESLENFVVDRNKYSLHDYTYLGDNKYLCRNTQIRYINNIVELDLKNNSIKDIFPSDLHGEIFYLKKFNDNRFCFLATMRKNRNYLCFFTDPAINK